MQNKISSFAKMEEPDRMLFIAQLHHAMWHDEAIYRTIDSIITRAEDRVPEAIYFPSEHQLDEIKNDTI